MKSSLDSDPGTGARDTYPADEAAGGAPSKIGRYTLLSVLGEGGMGVVYSALDPELNRKVALKLLRSAPAMDPEMARARLLREAQAMARVSHPNVLPVFDAGVWEGQVFLTMELVDGVTLTRWLATANPTWREILEKFLAAGKGLEAAHAAGLVHRDFKPGNVLVSRAGRVYVTDFGLARDVGATAEASAVSDEAPTDVAPVNGAPRTAASPLLETPLTTTGQVMGTPMYMSPEQHLGKAVDARSDQFSFCVSLYYALYGKRPFDPTVLRMAVLQGFDDKTGAVTMPLESGRPGDSSRRLLLIQEPPRDAKVPAWIRQAVMRGLSIDPAERFPSMGALLEALSQERRLVRRRQWIMAAAAVAVLGVLVGGALYQRSRLCAGADRLMDEVWGPPTRQRVEAAFEATGRPFARDVFRRAAEMLDGYARTWTQQRTEVCEATRLRGVQTEELMFRREVCLERRRREMRTFVEMLAAADGPLVEKSMEVAYALPTLQECADPGEISEKQPLPADPGKRADVEKLQAGVAELMMLVEAGRYDAAEEKARPLRAAVDATGYLPLMAELRFHLGQLEIQLGKDVEAARELWQGAFQAEAGRADRLKILLLNRLLAVDSGRKRYDLADRWAGLAEASLQRIGGDPELESYLLVSRGSLAAEQERLPEARAYYEKALTLQRRVLPSGHPQRARAASLSGELLARMGDRTRAVGLLSEALEQTEAAMGKQHPDVAKRHAALAVAMREMGDPAQALEHARAAVGIRTAAFGPKGLEVADSLDELGRELHELNRDPEALEAYQQALAARVAALEPGDAKLASAYDRVGQALLGLGRAAEAIAPLQKALTLTSAEPGPLAESRFTLARALAVEGRQVEARKEAKRALERFEEAGEDMRAAEVAAWLDSLPKQKKPSGRRR